MEQKRKATSASLPGRQGVTRRKFLKAGVAAGAAGLLGSRTGSSAGQAPLAAAPKPGGVLKLAASVIVIGAEATASEKYAAEELASYLEKMTGRKIEVVGDASVPQGQVIAVGRSKLTDSMDTASLDVEQCIIDVRTNMLVIVGGRRSMQPGKSARDAGTLYGVYDFLEGLGVRWYRPEPWGEHVPRLAEISLRIGKRVSSPPAYLLRSGFFGGMSYFREETQAELEQARRWAARNRLNNTMSPSNNYTEVDVEYARIWAEQNRTDPVRPGAYRKDLMLVSKFGGSERYEWHHIYPTLIPESEYFKSHPEYFALVKGKRDPIDLCLGNTELQRVFAEKLIAKAKATPYQSSLSAEPSDGRGGTCECPLCKALDQPMNTRPGGQASNRVVVFNSVIARMVAKEAPWVKVQWLAYSTHTAAPTNVKRLEPNVIIMLAPINAWSDWRKKLFDSSSRQNALFVKTAKDWAALEPSSLMVYEYFEGYAWPGPLPVTRTVTDRMRNYRKLGINGIFNETVTSWGPMGLDQYMSTKLMWNPDLDVDAELDLYYKNYYGPAARPMKGYHERLMNALETHAYPVSSGGRGMHLVFTPALVKALGNYVSEAQALVKNQPLYERRLKGVRAGYEFSRRVSEILVLKKKHGVLTDTAAGGSYYQSAEANDAYRDLIRWMRSVNADDAVFDMALKFKDDAAKNIFIQRGENFGSSFHSYLPGDLLKNTLNSNIREEVVLKDF
jgi:uncharacterized protein DUF4838